VKIYTVGVFFFLRCTTFLQLATLYIQRASVSFVSGSGHGHVSGCGLVEGDGNYSPAEDGKLVSEDQP
jgi:hypothetical protein